MGKRHQTFIAETINIDFKNSLLVAKELISAIEHYKRFELFCTGEDIDNATEKLTNAGTIAYRAMEHAYKNYIYYYYKEKYDKGDIAQAEFESNILFLTNPVNGHFATHKDLKDKFCSLVTNPAADLDEIFNGTQKSSNGPKHEYKIPNPVKLKVQLGEMIKFFKEYVYKDIEYPVLTDSLMGDECAWVELLDDCDGFSDAFHYVLVSPNKIEDKKNNVKNLWSIPWDLIIDFDTESDTSGLASQYISIYHISPEIRTLSYAEHLQGFRAMSSTQWIMANGFLDREETVTNNYKVWKRKYGKNLSETLRKFHATYTKTIRLIILPGIDENYINDIIESCAEAFVAEDGITVSNIDIIILSASSTCLGLDEDFVKRSSLTMEEFLIRLGKRAHSVNEESNKKLIPGVNKEEGLKNDLFSKLSNFCEVVYNGIELKDACDDVKAFYNGERPISWGELSKHKDLERKIYISQIYKMINDIMESHPKGFYEVFYKPGYGGTTMLRRIAWDFHDIYPTIIVNQYQHDDINHLKQLYGCTKKTILVLVDSNFISRDIARKIWADMKSEGISLNLIYMRRIERNADIGTKMQLFKLPSLGIENGEVANMVGLLKPYAINSICTERLESFLKKPTLCEELSPFYFAFSTFDENFKGIKNYIKNFTSTLSNELKEFLVFMALADYINKPLDIQYFARILRNDDVVDFLSENGAFRTLVSFIKMPNNQMFCKVKYSAFAKEILRQASNNFSNEEIAEIRYISLTDHIIKFIEMSRPAPQIRNNSVVEFIREMLITRRADLDMDRPKFANLVSKIGKYNANGVQQWSQEGQAAVSRIFNQLVKTYPEDPHFRAHLARYLCYVEKDYNHAIELLDEAIGMYTDGSEEDLLLLHMKAMVYAARITQKLIPDIKRKHKTAGCTEDDELFMSLHSDLQSANALFKCVRDLHRGIAGHISNISLFVSIIDMGKAIDEMDTAMFLEKHHDDWYFELADQANNLFEECEELEEALDDDEKERVEEVRLLINTIKNGISDTIQQYGQYLGTVSEEKRPFIRRYLARAYAERNMSTNNQKDWMKIAELMADNMLEDSANPTNIRIWFNAITHIKSEDPDDMLRQAIIKLNEWVALSENNIEAHFYRYILTFIQAIEGITDAESRLPGYLIKLQGLASNLVNKTSIRYWVGRNGNGIERLIPKDKFPLNDVDKANSLLRMVKGRVSEKYVNDFHAYISTYHSDVFFSPNSTDGRINVTNKNAVVVMGFGFSYDGPRAYNSSIKLYTGEEDIELEELPPLQYGTIVKCKVIKNSTPHYINVEIVGYNVEGSIPIECLDTPYDDLHRPQVDGPLLNAMVLNQKQAISAGGMYRTIWSLTMKGDVLFKDHENDMSDFQKKLQKIKNSIK